jgi:hypothetical protein
MAEAPGSPDGIEAMAFQLLLHKVTTLEHAVQSLPPLLAKIIAHLEAQGKQPEVPIATYAQLYPELWDEAPEEEATEETGAVMDVTPVVADRTRRRRRFWHWFVKETA